MIGALKSKWCRNGTHIILKMKQVVNGDVSARSNLDHHESMLLKSHSGVLCIDLCSLCSLCSLCHLFHIYTYGLYRL